MCIRDSNNSSKILTFTSKILQQRELRIRIILYNLHQIVNTILTDDLFVVILPYLSFVVLYDKTGAYIISISTVLVGSVCITGGQWVNWSDFRVNPTSNANMQWDWGGEMSPSNYHTHRQKCIT